LRVAVTGAKLIVRPVSLSAYPACPGLMTANISGFGIPIRSRKRGIATRLCTRHVRPILRMVSALSCWKRVRRSSTGRSESVAGDILSQSSEMGTRATIRMFRVTYHMQLHVVDTSVKKDSSPLAAVSDPVRPLLLTCERDLRGGIRWNPM